MKLIRKLGATSQILQVFIRDSSSTTGAGLTGLLFNTASLTAYFHRDTDTTATQINLVTMTVGTFTSSGFKEIDSTNMPGWYQFCPPNTALANGASSVGFHLKGATNMAPLPIEIDLDAQVDVTSWLGTAVASPATAGIPDVNAKNINNVATTSVTTINTVIGTATVGSTATALATAQSGITTLLVGVNLNASQHVIVDSGTVTTVTNLTNAPTSGDFTATMKTSIGTAVAASAVASVTGNVGGNVVGTVSLASSGMDAVLVESSIGASAALTNDAGTQLTSINARQALALSISPLAGLLSGAGTTTVAIKPGGNASGNTRVSATVDVSGNRTASNIKVPT